MKAKKGKCKTNVGKTFHNNIVNNNYNNDDKYICTVYKRFEKQKKSFSLVNRKYYSTNSLFLNNTIKNDSNFHFKDISYDFPTEIKYKDELCETIRKIKQLNIKTYENWHQITSILSNSIDKNSINNYLSNIIPHFEYTDLMCKNSIKKRNYWKKMENQIQFMFFLYQILNLTSMNDWIKVKKKEFYQNGGKYLLSFYSFNKKKLLETIFVNYRWENKEEKLENGFFHSINNQKKFMEEKMKKFELKSLNDFANFEIKKRLMNEENFRPLLVRFYQNNYTKLLKTLFPNFNFQFKKLQREKGYWNSFSHQTKFLEYLYYKLNLKSIDQFNYQILIQNGASSLLNKFHYRISDLLTTIFPNFPFKKYDKEEKIFWTEISNQILFFDDLFYNLRLKKIDDFSLLQKNQIFQHGGKEILSQYNYKLSSLLSTLYPNFPWNFNERIKTEKYSNLLLSIQKKYQITRKEEWYRIPLKDLYQKLKSVHFDQDWNKFHFSRRVKQANQRALFLSLQQLFPNFEIRENYFHPSFYLPSSNQTPSLSPSSLPTHSSHLQLDIFIPSLNLALEYQGEQHYDDIPSCFAHNDFYQTRDLFKSSLCSAHSIDLISIPYWCDLSTSSVQLFIDQIKYQKNEFI